MTTPKFNIPEVVGQTLSFQTLNQILRHYESLDGLTVISTETAPVVSPVDGAAYLVGSPATGAFVGRENHVAFSIGGAYYFLEFGSTIVGKELYHIGNSGFLFWTGTEWINSPSFSQLELTLAASANLDYARNIALDSTTVGQTFTLPTPPVGFKTMVTNIGIEDLTVDYTAGTLLLVAGSSVELLQISSGWIVLFN